MLFGNLAFCGGAGGSRSPQYRKKSPPPPRNVQKSQVVRQRCGSASVWCATQHVVRKDVAAKTNARVCIISAARDCLAPPTQQGIFVDLHPNRVHTRLRTVLARLGISVTIAGSYTLPAQAGVLQIARDAGRRKPERRFGHTIFASDPDSMSAEGKPQSDRSFMARPLEWLARLVTRFPVATLVLAGVVTAVALYLTVTRLGFRTSRAELLNPKSDFNQRWIEYTKEFGDKEDVVVVVEGDGREQRRARARRSGAALAEDGGKNYQRGAARDRPAKIRAKGLYYLKPEELTAIDGFLDQLAPSSAATGRNSTRRHGQWMSASLPAGRRRAARAGHGRHDRIASGA